MKNPRRNGTSPSMARASVRALHGIKPSETKTETRAHNNKYAEHSRAPNLKVWGDSIAEDLARLPSRPVASLAAVDAKGPGFGSKG